MKVTPYKNSELSKKQQVENMFDNIAWRYDFLNHFLSLGIDHYWRRKTIASIKPYKPRLILDVATGTADLALAAIKIHPEKIYGVDISEDMLKIGREKIKNKNLSDKIELLRGDSENLIFEENKFDALTVGFGVRNFEHTLNGLKEMYRVLKPGAPCAVLEFSKPKSFPFKQTYNFYTNKITPAVGKMISKDDAAYRYLKDSVDAFPEGEDFKKLFQQAGFSNITIRPLTFGVVTLYCGIK